MSARRPLVGEGLTQCRAGKLCVVFVSELEKPGVSLGARRGDGK